MAKHIFVNWDAVVKSWYSDDIRR